MRPTLYRLSQPSISVGTPNRVSSWSPQKPNRTKKNVARTWFASSPLVNIASVAEWLRRQTQVLVLFEGVSSNLTGCITLLAFFSLQLMGMEFLDGTQGNDWRVGWL